MRQNIRCPFLARPALDLLPSLLLVGFKGKKYDVIPGFFSIILGISSDREVVTRSRSEQDAHTSQHKRQSQEQLTITVRLILTRP